jgi:DNA polymerase-3 subunit alpha
MAIFTLEDLNGSVDCVIFPDALALYEYLMQPDQMVFLRGMVDFRREDPSIRVNKVYDMHCAEEMLTDAVLMQFDTEMIDKKNLEILKNLCHSHPGKCPVYLQITTKKNMRVVIQIDSAVKPDTEFCRKLETLVGTQRYKLLRPHDKLHFPPMASAS